MDETIYEDKTTLYTAKEEGEDIGKKFVESLEKDLKEVYKILKTVVPINISEQEEESFKNAIKCYACGLDLKEYDRVRDHCHLTGKYRGAAHSKCNLKMRTPKFVPVLFHNLEGYDSHLFVKSLGGKVSCIPKTDEKYISFSKYIEINDNTKSDEEMRLIRAVRAMEWTKEEIAEMIDWTDEEIDQVLNLTDEECEKTKLKPKTSEIRFLDSIKFTLKSLDALAKGLGQDQFKSLEKEMGDNELLKKKGVFPDEFMTDFEKLNVNKLPPKSKFYSRLNDSNITDEEYKHAENVWKEFNCKTMRDYHDLYLKTDVLLLADVMENYRNTCIDNYKLDPLWYYTAPGLARGKNIKNRTIINNRPGHVFNG